MSKFQRDIRWQIFEIPSFLQSFEYLPADFSLRSFDTLHFIANLYTESYWRSINVFTTKIRLLLKALEVIENWNNILCNNICILYCIKDAVIMHKRCSHYAVIIRRLCIYYAYNIRDSRSVWKQRLNNGSYCTFVEEDCLMNAVAATLLPSIESTLYDAHNLFLVNLSSYHALWPITLKTPWHWYASDASVWPELSKRIFTVRGSLVGDHSLRTGFFSALIHFRCRTDSRMPSLAPHRAGQEWIS
jgi:hypothetical protein